MFGRKLGRNNVVLHYQKVRPVPLNADSAHHQMLKQIGRVRRPFLQGTFEYAFSLDLGFRLCGLGFRVQGLAFSGFRV